MDEPEVEALVAQIEAFVTRHSSATDALEHTHLDRCIDEAQEADQRRTLSPFLPTSARDLATLFTALEIGPGHLLVDLGCGDGRPLLAAALMRGCRGIGVDISQDCIALAQSVAQAEGISNEIVKFIQVDLLMEDAALARLMEEVERQDEDETGPIHIFLYVYPTLLVHLASLVGQLVHAWGKTREIAVVTLTYHFEPVVVADWVAMGTCSKREWCEGRFQVCTWGK